MRCMCGKMVNFTTAKIKSVQVKEQLQQVVILQYTKEAQCECGAYNEEEFYQVVELK